MANDDSAQKNATVLRFMENALNGGEPLSFSFTTPEGKKMRGRTDGSATDSLGMDDVTSYLQVLKSIPSNERSEVVEKMVGQLERTQEMSEEGSNIQIPRKQYLPIVLKEMKENSRAAVATLDDPSHPHKGYEGKLIAAESVNPVIAEQKHQQDNEAKERTTQEHFQNKQISLDHLSKSTGLKWNADSRAGIYVDVSRLSPGELGALKEDLSKMSDTLGRQTGNPDAYKFTIENGMLMFGGGGFMQPDAGKLEQYFKEHPLHTRPVAQGHASETQETAQKVAGLVSPDILDKLAGMSKQMLQSGQTFQPGADTTAMAVPKVASSKIELS